MLKVDREGNRYTDMNRYIDGVTDRWFSDDD